MLTFSDVGDSMSHRVSDEGAVEVQGMSLYELLSASKFDTVDLMKLDIEGTEEAFLCENPELLKRVNILVVELHPNVCDTQKVMFVNG